MGATRLRGEILSYDSTTGTGLISGDDGARYDFTSAALQSPAVPAAGVRVDFVPEGSVATQILIMAGGPTPTGVAGFATATAAPGSGFDFKTALLSFEGRLRRSHFWIGFLILFGANVVLGWIPLIGLIVWLASIWGHVAISVKRLHDMGKTGWYVVAPYVASIALSIIGVVMMFGGMAANGFSEDYYEGNPAAALALMGPAMGLFGLALLTGFVFLLWIGLVDSQKGENRFGPNPKGE